MSTVKLQNIPEGAGHDPIDNFQAEQEAAKKSVSTLKDLSDKLSADGVDASDINELLSKIDTDRTDITETAKIGERDLVITMLEDFGKSHADEGGDMYMKESNKNVKSRATNETSLMMDMNDKAWYSTDTQETLLSNDVIAKLAKKAGITGEQAMAAVEKGAEQRQAALAAGEIVNQRGPTAQQVAENQQDIKESQYQAGFAAETNMDGYDAAKKITAKREAETAKLEENGQADQNVLDEIATEQTVKNTETAKLEENGQTDQNVLDEIATEQTVKNTETAKLEENGQTDQNVLDEIATEQTVKNTETAKLEENGQADQNVLDEIATEQTVKNTETAKLEENGQADQNVLDEIATEQTVKNTETAKLEENGQADQNVLDEIAVQRRDKKTEQVATIDTKKSQALTTIQDFSTDGKIDFPSAKKNLRYVKAVQSLVAQELGETKMTELLEGTGISLSKFVDGDYGKTTEKVITYYQKNNLKVTADGDFGDISLAALNRDETIPNENMYAKDETRQTV